VLEGNWLVLEDGIEVPKLDRRVFIYCSKRREIYI
jgi:hypothetical protein